MVTRKRASTSQCLACQPKDLLPPNKFGSERTHSRTPVRGVWERKGDWGEREQRKRESESSKCQADRQKIDFAQKGVKLKRPRDPSKMFTTHFFSLSPNFKPFFEREENPQSIPKRKENIFSLVQHFPLAAITTHKTIEDIFSYPTLASLRACLHPIKYRERTGEVDLTVI